MSERNLTREATLLALAISNHLTEEAEREESFEVREERERARLEERISRWSCGKVRIDRCDKGLQLLMPGDVVDTLGTMIRVSRPDTQDEMRHDVSFTPVEAIVHVVLIPGAMYAPDPGDE